MYDTVVVFSPYLDDYLVDFIETFCIRNEGKIIESNEMIYSFTRCELEGSFDYRIRINIMDFEWKRIGSIPCKIKTEKKYIRVECSLHKLLLGHNVYGGPERFHNSIFYLIRFLESKFNTNLPDYALWTIERIDFAHIFDLGTIENVKQFTHQLKDLKYPRRKSPLCYDGALYYPGAVNTTKMYAKYLEFKHHDYKRIVKYCKKQIDNVYNINNEVRKLDDWDKDVVNYYNIISNAKSLLKKTNGILRIEVEIKKRKLLDLFGNNTDFIYLKNNDTINVREGIMISNVNENLLEKYFYETINNLFNGVKADNMVNDSVNVLKRLNDNFDNLKVQTLFSTWSMMSLHGEDFAKDNLSKATFYRHKSILKELGCNWNFTDIKVVNQENNPIEFFSYMLKNLCVSGECPEVMEKLDNVA